jgi:hypothetical protein
VHLADAAFLTGVIIPLGFCRSIARLGGPNTVAPRPSATGGESRQRFQLCRRLFGT